MEVSLPLFLLFSMIASSHAAYCVCKDGGSDANLQKVIDYACGAGADCTQIQQSGQCFQPNTAKSHCDIAVNSYYQRKASSGATCDFNGVAVLTNSPPSTSSSCLSGSGSTGTPTTGTPTSGTPTTGTPTMGTPTTGTPTMGTPTMGTPTSTSSSVFPGTSTMGPTGSGGFDQSSVDALSVGTAITTAAVFLTTTALLKRI